MTTMKFSDFSEHVRFSNERTDEIRSTDLRKQAEQLTAEGKEWEYARYDIRGESTMIDVLFVPEADRAGVAWGGDADWTDATSIADALQRYFGIDGKEMVH